MAPSVIYRVNPSFEDANNYRPGGFHPVHLHDTFHNGRYQVLHKLGHGTYATVWLVKDRDLGRFRSLKILTAADSESVDVNEIAIVRRLMLNESANLGREYVIELFDDFMHVGPNGSHMCIVGELLCPSLSSDVEDIFGHEEYPLEFGKRIAAQIAGGLEYLHSCGIVHGDLHPGNILLHYPPITTWSLQEIEKYLGSPIKRKLELNGPGESPPVSPHVPDYLVYPANGEPLLELCLSSPSKVHVKICDFGESFIWSFNQPLSRKLNTPFVYAAPEVTLRDAPGPNSDVWALACIFYFLFSSRSLLFSVTAQREDVLPGIVFALGKLPDRWWNKWEDRGLYLDENGKWIGDEKHLFNLSRNLLRTGRKMDAGDREVLQSLIMKMVEYEPEARIDSKTVVKLIPRRWMEDTSGERQTPA